MIELHSKKNHLHHLVIKILLVLLIVGILQSCKSYDNYRPTKKDQKAIIENWLTIRKKVSKNHERNDTLYMTFITNDKIRYILEQRKRVPGRLSKDDSLRFYNHFFNNSMNTNDHYRVRRNKRKRQGIVVLEEKEIISNKKIDSMSYPLFSKDGKEAILYGSTVTKTISQIAIFKKREDGKWIMVDVFPFY
ncbi:hypothetical protein [Aquimarina rhabdastrellae]